MSIVDCIIFAIACICSYLLGGVSIARLVLKKSGANQGSGNPGTMNMLRTQGFGMGIFTLFCDALKGAIPALFGLIYYGYFYSKPVAFAALFIFGLCAVLGHIFPIYYKFKGGKGIATTFGVFAVADPISTVILFGIMFVVLYFIKIGSVVSLLFITIDAIVQCFKRDIHSSWVALVFMWLMIVLDIYAHRTNLERLVENRENPADLQEGLQKDIDKIRKKREKKLERNAMKSEKIDKKYENKINKKSVRVQKKIDRITERSEKKTKKTSVPSETNDIQADVSDTNEK